MTGLDIFLLAIFCHVVSGDVKTDASTEANKPVYHVVYRPQSYRQYGSYGYDNSYRRYDDSYRRHGDSNTGYGEAEAYGAYQPSYDSGSERLYLSGGIFRPYGYDDETYAYDTGSKPYAYDMRYYDDTDGRYAKYPYSRRQY